MSLPFIQLLILIVFANGVPVIAHRLMGHKFNWPVDLGFRFIDGRRLLGNSKTWRGLASSVVLTAGLAMLMGYECLIGVQVAAGALAGDLCSSFIKRRLGLRSSAMAPLLDQVPESLFPALLMMSAFALDSKDVVILVLAFIILELLLSTVAYRLGIRRTPY